MQQPEDREDGTPPTDLVVRPATNPGDDALAGLVALIVRWQASHRRGAPRWERLQVEEEMLAWRR